MRGGGANRFTDAGLQGAHVARRLRQGGDLCRRRRGVGDGGENRGVGWARVGAGAGAPEGGCSGTGLGRLGGEVGGVGGWVGGRCEGRGKEWPRPEAPARARGGGEAPSREGGEELGEGDMEGARGLCAGIADAHID